MDLRFLASLTLLLGLFFVNTNPTGHLIPLYFIMYIENITCVIIL